MPTEPTTMNSADAPAGDSRRVLSPRLSGPPALLTVLALTTAATAGRLLIDEPNVTPIVACVLLAAWLLRPGFRSVLTVAAIAPVSLLVGGWVRPEESFAWSGHELWISLSVFAVLALPAALGPLLAGRGRLAQSRFGVAGVAVGGSLMAACLFFLLTNLAVWAATPWYTKNWSGLLLCYESAIPFFRGTLKGDVGFTLLAFASALALQAAVDSMFRDARRVSPASAR